MIASITGAFKTFSGEVISESDDFNNAKVNVEIDATSISTDHTERDSHLRSPLFLNTEKFPKITFTGILNKKSNEHELTGDITICGVTKQIILAVELTGTGKGRFNDMRTGFEVSGRINRRDFGLDFSLLTDAGNIIVGEELKLNFNIQVIQQVAA